MKLLESNQRGIGLLEVLIVSGIVLLLIQFMNQVFEDYQSNQRQKRIKISEKILKSYLNDSVDCNKTLNDIGNTCNIGEDLQISSNLNAKPILIKIGSASKNDYTKIGKFQVRARCGKCKNNCASELELNIESRLVDKQNKPINHLRHKKSDWDSIYRKIPFKCTFL